MDYKIISAINDDFNEILEIKDIWDIDKYMKRFTIGLICSDKLKKLLYEETDYCLDIFNNCLKGIIGNYINQEINLDELKNILDFNFNIINTKNKEKFNEIFPEFIKLLIDELSCLLWCRSHFKS